PSPRPTPARPPRSALFPYTTLFRSRARNAHGAFPRRPGIAGEGRGHMADRLEGNTHGVDRQRLGLGDDDADCTLQFRRMRAIPRSEEHTSELQSRENLVCRLLLEKK